MLSVHTLQQILSVWGYLAVFAFVAIEYTGIPFPGETMLITAAIYAGAGHLSIAGVIAAAALGSLFGGTSGYWIGRTGGRKLALRYGKYVRLDDGRLGRAEHFFQHYGDKAVFFGRFIAVLRAWSTFLAGVNRMPWAKFVVFNTAGSVCWSAAIGILAFKLGQNFERFRGVLGWGAVAAVILGALVAYLLHRHFTHRIVHRSQGDQKDEKEGGAIPIPPSGGGDSRL
jgi:membrane protein DedA with SNARE-associated domain